MAYNYQGVYSSAERSTQYVSNPQPNPGYYPYNSVSTSVPMVSQPYPPYPSSTYGPMPTNPPPYSPSMPMNPPPYSASILRPAPTNPPPYSPLMPMNPPISPYPCPSRAYTDRPPMQYPVGSTIPGIYCPQCGALCCEPKKGRKMKCACGYVTERSVNYT